MDEQRDPQNVIETSDISINSPGASLVAARACHLTGDHFEECSVNSGLVASPTNVGPAIQPITEVRVNVLIERDAF